jgi:hypothetical protein
MNSEGVAILSVEQAKAQDSIKTLVRDGHIISRVESCRKN